MDWIYTSIKYTIDVKSKVDACDLLKLAKTSFPRLDDEFCIENKFRKGDCDSDYFNLRFVLDKRIVQDSDISNNGKTVVVNKIRDFLNSDLIIDCEVKVTSTSAKRCDLYTNEIRWTY